MATASVKTTPQVKQATGSKTQLPVTTPKAVSRNNAPTVPVTVKYTIDAEVIKCPACLEVFKSPRVLQCGHSLCLSCLDSLIMYTASSSDKDQFPCPVCFKNAKPRDTKVIRQKWAYQFPTNAVVCRMLRNATIKNLRDDSSHKAFCDICIRNNKTRTTACYCNNCLEHLCSMCLEYHGKQEDNKDHDVTLFAQRDDLTAAQDEAKRRLRTQLSFVDKADGERRGKTDTVMPDGKLASVNTIVAQTVTAADSVTQKTVIKIGAFNGKAPADSATSDFRSGIFLSNYRVVFGDLANKKLKVFDITHKTRVELIVDLTIRADPIHMCRVDDHTIAVATERAGNFHVRLFIIREKIMHFVHQMLDAMPIDISCLNNTIFCSFLGDSALHKYRMSRSQQLKLGTVKQDRHGHDLFHHPGTMCSGIWNGIPVIFAADETEYGVTVLSLDCRGDRKSSVFFEIPVIKPKPPKRSANTTRLTRNTSKRALTANRNNGLNSTQGKSDTPPTPNTSVRPVRKSASQSVERKPSERASGHNTFRRVDEFQVIKERKDGREIERPPMPLTMKKELTIDLYRLTADDMDLNGTIRSVVNSGGTRKSTTTDSKAVERVKRPVGKVTPQMTNQPTDGKEMKGSASTSSTAKPSSANSTIGSNSTVGTTQFTVPPKVVYRADCIDVDVKGNIYVCMSSLNKVHQMSPDGKINRDLLTEKDGLVAPKMIRFSPKNDFFLVTSLKNNKVMLYKLKHI